MSLPQTKCIPESWTVDDGCSHTLSTPAEGRLMGIALAGETQIILADTPGLFEPKRRLDRAMVSAAWDGALPALALRS